MEGAALGLEEFRDYKSCGSVMNGVRFNFVLKDANQRLKIYLKNILGMFWLTASLDDIGLTIRKIELQENQERNLSNN